MHHPSLSRSRRRAFLRCTALLAASTTLAAAPDDWPQWRGPRGDNVSRETAWSSVGQPEPLWKIAIGRGYSSPAIAAGKLVIDGYFPSAEDEKAGADRVQCFDAATGKLRWSQSYPASAYDNEHRGGTLSTPTITGDTVYVAARDGVVRAYALEDGTLRWTVDLKERHGVEPGRYGFASSPLVSGERLIVNCASPLALDRASGATVWIAENRDANYATAAPIRLGEQDGFVVFGGLGLAVIDGASGALLRSYAFRKTPKNVEGATPIVMGTRVFISSGYEQGAALVDFASDPPREIWRSRHMRNKLAGSTLFEGHLYGFDESMLKCLDLEGEERWRVRGLGQGALMIAGGRLLLTTSDGELVVARATPEAFAEESRRAVLEDGVFWTAPVLCDGLVYFRGSQGELVCLDHRLDAASAASSAGAAEAAATPSDAAALPAPQELEKRYLAAAKLSAEAPPALRFRGKLHIVALGVENSAAMWEIGAPHRWHVRYDLPPGIGGAIDRCFDGELAWEKNPYRGDKLIEGAELDELRRTSGHRDLFDPLPAGVPAVIRGIRAFRGARCYEVELELAREPRLVRSVYFDAQSGLLAGRTAPSEATVSWSDWRPCGELVLPFARTVFDPESGIEQRWTFDSASLEGPDAEQCVLPESLKRRG